MGSYKDLSEQLKSYCTRVGLTVDKEKIEGTTLTFVVKNESANEDHILEKCELFLNDPTVKVELSFILPFPVAKQSEQRIKVTIRGVSEVFKNYLIFDFGGNTKCHCEINIPVITDAIKLLMPNGEYKAKEKKIDYQSKFSNAVEGVKPPMDGSDITGPPDRGVPGRMRHKPTSCLLALRQPLTMENYTDYFHKLLWLDEMSREGNIREYDMHLVSLICEKDFLCLDVPGLLKRRDEVRVGNKLIFSKPDNEDTEQEGGAQQRGGAQQVGGAQQEAIPSFAQRENYIGYVHEISGERLKLKFNPKFHASRELWSRKYDVMFTVSRGPLIRMHKALEGTQKEDGGKILFPTTKPPTRPSLEFASQNLQFIDQKLNDQQKRAVKAIVQGACHPIPYILFGPPGTGKTSTVVESILQVYKRNVTCNILACTPSNSAADLLAVRLQTSGFIEEGAMIRLNAFMRTQPVPSSIQNLCVIANKKAKSRAKSSRIVICTCSTAAVLATFNMKFSYVFVDEAGQALEPECLIPVTLLDADSGQLVLAGDPLQLGPVVFSSLASQNGLSTSMLERLMGRDLYKRDTTVYAATGNYDSMLVTKLVENYRSHGTLLKLYSDQFYDGELVEKADRSITHRLCNWEHLPTKGVPLLFYGIQGDERREYGSPSWFNPFEAEKVMFYAKHLVKGKLVKEEDIGIISPYNKQVEKMKLLLLNEGLINVKVGSVEEFQGQEYLVVIISTVRSSDDMFIEDARRQVGFVSNPKRFNVAISRARALLIVVGNPHLLAQAVNTVQGGTAGQDPPIAEQSSCWSKLIQFAVHHGCYAGCPLPTPSTSP